MAERRIINGYIVERQPDGTLVTIGPAGAQPVTIGQRNPVKVAKEAADAAKAQADAVVASRTAPAQVRQAEAEAASAAAQAAKNQADAQTTAQEAARLQNAQARKSVMDAFKTKDILDAIRNARAIAMQGGTGFQSLLSAIPETKARALRSELNPIKSNLTFDRLQQMREESKTGGAVGQASDADMKLLGSTVRDLDTGVDLQTFLRRLDTIEQHFLGVQLATLGVQPDTPEWQQGMRDLGYQGSLDGQRQEDRQLAAPGSSEAAGVLPEGYQREHLRYLRQHWGNIDPQDYAAFRTQLDNAYGQRPDIKAYEAAVPGYNQAAHIGGTPEQLGQVPAAPRQMGAIEAGLNRAAQTAPGTYFANAGNAVAAGLPVALGGDQNQLDLLRQARPISSLAGEMTGGALGAAALGGAGGMAAGGGRLAQMLTSPGAAELAHSTLYGATQDPGNPLRGAAFGAGGSMFGSALGRQVGKAFPTTYARGAIRRADESVPSIDDLKGEASQLYADAEARGVAAGPQETTDLAARMNQILAREGRIGGNGQPIIQDGSTKQGYDLVQSYANGTMSPSQAGTVRETLGEGLTSNVPKERRIAGELLREFDDWSQPVMPGADQARKVASRYIRGQQLEDLTGRGLRRGARMKGNDAADSMRTLYGQLDEKVGLGQAYFDQPTEEAIARVARGDKLTNGLRQLGKYGFGNPLTAGGAGIGTGAAIGGLVDPIYAGSSLALGTAGTLARRAANNRTLRAAIEAENTALGGDDYLRLLEDAQRQAAATGGRIYGGMFGAGASRVNRTRRSQ